MELDMEMGTDLEVYMNSDSGPPSIVTRSDIRLSEETEAAEMSRTLEIESEPREEEGECSTSVGTIRYAPSSVDTDASLLSMPDPLYSSLESFSEPSLIDTDSVSVSELVSVYTSEFSSAVGSGVPSRPASPLSSFHQEMPENADNGVDAQFSAQIEHEVHLGGDPDTESDDLEASDSESSFPSVTSSFFFSSPASPSAGEEDTLSHDESTGEESQEESSHTRGLRATEGLIIPSLTLPESLLLPTPRPHPENMGSSGGLFPNISHATTTSNDAHPREMLSRVQDDTDVLRFLIVSARDSISDRVSKELLGWDDSEPPGHALQWEGNKTDGMQLRTKIFRRRVSGIDATNAAEIYSVSLDSSSDATSGGDAVDMLKKIVFGPLERGDISPITSITKGIPPGVKGKGKAGVLIDGELQHKTGPLFIAMILVEPSVEEDLNNSALRLTSTTGEIGDLKDLVPTIHLHLQDRGSPEPDTQTYTHTSTPPSAPARTSTSVSFKPSAAHYRTSYKQRSAPLAGGNSGYVYEQSLPPHSFDTWKSRPTKPGNKRRLSSFSKSQAWRQAQEQIKSETHSDSLDHVWGVDALRQLLFHDLHALASLRSQATERWIRWASLQNTAGASVDSLFGREQESLSDVWRDLGHGREETITPSALSDPSPSPSGSKWRAFKAEWEATWEGTPGEESDQQPERAIAIRMREFASPSSASGIDSTGGESEDNEDDLLRIAKASAKSPSFAARRSLPNPHMNGRAGTLRARRQAHISRDTSQTAFPSMSPRPEVSPTQATIPLTAGFPFPLSIHSRSRRRSHSEGSVARDSSSSSSDNDIENDTPSRPSFSRTPSKSHVPPIMIDLQAAAFDPLHLPSLFIFSLSLLGPLRARVAHTISTTEASVRNSVSRVFWTGTSIPERWEDVFPSEDGVELQEVTDGERVLDPCSFSISSCDSEMNETQGSHSFAKTVFLAGASFILGVGVGVGLGLISGRFCRLI